MNTLAWLALKSVPGIGNLLFKRLIDRFGDPQHVMGTSTHELQTVRGVSERLANLIRSCRAPEALVRDMDAAFAAGCRIVTINDERYPALLREIPDPPPYLYVKGRLPDQPMVAVVGSRNASRYGLSAARRLSGDLVLSGAAVVSGLARGVDTAAHQGSLEQQGLTVAVLGSGLGRIYPPENIPLAGKIAENGALVSEFPFFAGPEAHHFPIRNRIISGMSLGTVVVEATAKSGSLITARLAGEQNREVFAVPGSITSSGSSGTHSLIRQGARLVESVADILEELPPFHSRLAENSASLKKTGEEALEKMKNKFNLDFDELSVLKVLDSYPVHIDDILQHVSMEPGALSAVLLRLELKGMVDQSPGKLFSLNEDLL